MTLQPPRPFLTDEEIRALSEEERAVAVAEWSSYNARLRREHEQRAARGTYRGGRARGRGYGRGRGYYGYQYYQPYQPYQPQSSNFTNLSATFERSTSKPTLCTVAGLTTVSAGSHVPKVAQEKAAKIQEPCNGFTSTGICKRHNCLYLHNPDKTAICKEYLLKGACADGESCALSHEPSPNRSPYCIHFQKDRCNKEDCRYAHVQVNALAPVCRSFARLGFCEDGAQCANRHAFECPDFSEKGECDAKGCRLLHIVHAGRLRKARASSDPDSPPTPSSPETSDHLDIKQEKEDVLHDMDNGHSLTQQADYIPFDD